MTGECRLDDDGHGEMIAIEAGDQPQALWLRPGIVYDGDVVRAEPGVWITYQEHYMHSDLAGPVLLTPEVWDQLVRAMSKRLRAQRRSRIMRLLHNALLHGVRHRSFWRALRAGHDTVMRQAADDVMEKRLYRHPEPLPPSGPKLQAPPVRPPEDPDQDVWDYLDGRHTGAEMPPTGPIERMPDE